MSFETLIALRYVRAKRQESFISFISLVSVIGIALGVAALIIVLSVMNGFQKEIRTKMLGVASHLEASGVNGQLADWGTVQKALAGDPRVVATAPFVNAQGLLSSAGSVRGALIRGIDPAQEPGVVDVGEHMVVGKLTDLKPGGFGIVMGVEMARALGVGVGDKVNLITPEGQFTPAGMLPRLKTFTVAGLFKVGMFEYDSGFAMIDLSDAQRLFRLGGNVSGVRVKLTELMQAPQVKHDLYARVPDSVVLTDWTDMNASYFRAVQIEKRMMTIILTLIVAVAAFNLVSTLVMVVTDKRADIAILRTLGASPGSIMRIFMLQGALSGVIGTVSGVAGGVLIALNLDRIVPVIEAVLGTKLLSSDVYMIDHLPSDVQFADVSTIAIIALLLAFFATLYPSWRAARMQPAEALRYE
ncbi:MAG: lipoprotein-releasing ABC transporter permease subunit [Microvirgula sp.]